MYPIRREGRMRMLAGAWMGEQGTAEHMSVGNCTDFPNFGECNANNRALLYQYYHITFAQFWQVRRTTVNKLFTLQPIRTKKDRNPWGKGLRSWEFGRGIASRKALAVRHRQIHHHSVALGTGGALTLQVGIVDGGGNVCHDRIPVAVVKIVVGGQFSLHKGIQA